ncbi:hypothetical protein NA57DRAFT_71521 [Rhizodiscina lignyota]|uniref:Uncharacterized protein n=1 Tax=Rhizodiscina lignyota TaxID=1504668 RepID=A0A9P4IJ12_9PEZI|nr:hypothetical protein NA57DRAFT_71521 [Rhizodiscina lignyota]
MARSARSVPRSTGQSGNEGVGIHRVATFLSYQRPLQRPSQSPTAPLQTTPRLFRIRAQLVREALNYLYSDNVEYDPLRDERVRALTEYFSEGSPGGTTDKRLQIGKEAWLEKHLLECLAYFRDPAKWSKVSASVPKPFFPATSFGSIKRMVWTRGDAELFSMVEQFLLLNRLLSSIVINAGILDIMPAYVTQDAGSVRTPAGKLLTSFLVPAGIGERHGTKAKFKIHEPFWNSLRVKRADVSIDILNDYIRRWEEMQNLQNSKNKIPNKYPFRALDPAEPLPSMLDCDTKLLSKEANGLHKTVHEYLFTHLKSCSFMDATGLKLTYEDARMGSMDRSFLYTMQSHALHYTPGQKSKLEIAMINGFKRWVALQRSLGLVIDVLVDNDKIIDLQTDWDRRQNQWSVYGYNLTEEFPAAMRKKMLLEDSTDWPKPELIEDLSVHWSELVEEARALKDAEDEEASEYDFESESDDSLFCGHQPYLRGGAGPPGDVPEDYEVPEVRQINPEKLKTREQKFRERCAPTGEIWYRDHPPYFPFAEHPTMQSYWSHKPDIDKKVDDMMKWDKSVIGKGLSTISGLLSSKKAKTKANAKAQSGNAGDSDSIQVDFEESDDDDSLADGDDLEEEIRQFLENETAEQREPREKFRVRMRVEDRLKDETLKKLHVCKLPLPPAPNFTEDEKYGFRFNDSDKPYLFDMPEYDYSDLRTLIPPEDQLIEWAEDFDLGEDDEVGNDEPKTVKVQLSKKTKLPKPPHPPKDTGSRVESPEGASIAERVGSRRGKKRKNEETAEEPTKEAPGRKKRVRFD